MHVQPGWHGGELLVNAELRPIPRAIELASYDNAQTKNFDRWYVTNYAALKGRYEALGRSMPDQDGKDSSLAYSRAQSFLRFSMCQFDIARGAF